MDEVTIGHILCFLLGGTLVSAYQDVKDIMNSTGHSIKNRWKGMKRIEYSFKHDDFNLSLAVHFKQLVGQLIPEILRIKCETMDFESLVLEKGDYDLNFKIIIDWKKKK